MRSLRGRLTLGVTLALAAVLLVAGIVASRSIDASQRDVLDDRLVRTAELSRANALAAVQQGVPDADARLDAVLDATRSSVRLLVGDSVLVETGAPPARWPRLALGIQTFSVGGERYRAYATTLRDPSLAGLARLEVATSLRPVERREARLDRQLGALGLLALAVAGAAVWIAATLVLRPLRRLEHTASRVASDSDLGRRVPATRGARELRSLAESFNAMLARLGRSSAARERALAATRRFAADVGHELRTPLTSMQATLSALARHPDLPAPRRTTMVDGVLAEQRRLVDLLDGLQALARGDAAPVERTEIDLAELVDAALSGLALARPDVTVDGDLPDAPVLVDGWEPGLRLLVENLLQNAARHGCRGGGRIQVTLRGGELLVEDDGPGVPEAERERIFAPFARGEDAGGEADGLPRGSGLGLALVAQQARLHGATVTAGASPLGGARFAVRFPTRAASPATDAARVLDRARRA